MLACLLLTISSGAQLCQGSLGDPIVNITFGAGANPGAPLAAATTGYQFLYADCPDDGFYTVRNNSNSCFNNTFHSLTSDHTGNANGYFMLVNASYQPNAFYVDTVKGLCGSTTYEFAAWVLNIIRPNTCGGNPIQPILRFIIEKTDGTVLQSFNSGNIPSTPAPIWKQYGFFFTTPAGVSNVVLRIVNDAPGGCGNDIALDDITFRPCGPQVVPSIVGETSNTVNICSGTSRSFGFNSTISDFFTNPAYQWQQRFNGSTWADIPGATNRMLFRVFAATAAAGTYEYRLSVADAGNVGSVQCRVNSLPLTIIINAIPTATARSNTPVCSGSTLNLQATGSTRYTWTGPNGFSATSSNPSINDVQLLQSGTYIVIVASAAGCADTTTLDVTVLPSPTATTSFSDTTICIKNIIQLSAAGGIAYRWFPATGLSGITISNPVASPAVTTRYSVVAINALNCTDTAFINVMVNTPVVVNAGPNKTVVRSIPVTLEGSIQGLAQQFYWSPTAAFSVPQVIQPSVVPTVDATYILTAVSANGCGTVSDTVAVKVFKDIYVPNAFTPNGDGLNETWNIPALGAFPEFELVVCNRLGQVVFTNKLVNKPWDGKYKGAVLPSGTYVYSIKLNSNTDIFLKGTVLLLR